MSFLYKTKLCWDEWNMWRRKHYFSKNRILIKKILIHLNSLLSLKLVKYSTTKKFNWWNPLYFALFFSDFVIFQKSKYLKNRNAGKLKRGFTKSEYELVLQNIKENTYPPFPFHYIYGMLVVKFCQKTKINILGYFLKRIRNNYISSSEDIKPFHYSVRNMNKKITEIHAWIQNRSRINLKTVVNSTQFWQNMVWK